MALIPGGFPCGGPVRGLVVWVLFVSGFLAAPITRFFCFWAGVWGVWFGVVV